MYVIAYHSIHKFKLRPVNFRTVLTAVLINGFGLVSGSGPSKETNQAQPIAMISVNRLRFSFFSIGKDLHGNCFLAEWNCLGWCIKFNAFLYNENSIFNLNFSIRCCFAVKTVVGATSSPPLLFIDAIFLSSSC